MGSLNSFVTNRPVLSVLSITFCCFVLIMLLTGIATNLLTKDFGDLVTIIIGHLTGIALVKGGSIWPAFLAHFVVNTVIALQSNTRAITQPDLPLHKAVIIQLSSRNNWHLNYSKEAGQTRIDHLIKMAAPDTKNIDKLFSSLQDQASGLMLMPQNPGQIWNDSCTESRSPLTI